MLITLPSSRNEVQDLSSSETRLWVRRKPSSRQHCRSGQVACTEACCCISVAVETVYIPSFPRLDQLINVIVRIIVHIAVNNEAMKHVTDQALLPLYFIHVT